MLDELSEAGKELLDGFQSPGKACAGLLHLIARMAQLAGYVVVVGVAFSWLAGLGLLAAVLTFRQGNRGGLRRYSRVFRALAARRRESEYLRDLALRAPAAKEIRLFGLLPWLTARYRQVHWSWLRPVWRERAPDLPLAVLLVHRLRAAGHRDGAGGGGRGRGGSADQPGAGGPGGDGRAAAGRLLPRGGRADPVRHERVPGGAGVRTRSGVTSGRRHHARRRHHTGRPHSGTGAAGGHRLRPGAVPVPRPAIATGRSSAT